MRVARQSWPDAAAGAPADAPLSSPEEPLPLSPLGTPPVLFVPGWKNSGPGHWQTLWQASEPGWDRVMQRDWERPGPGAWLAALDARGSEGTTPPALAGGSPGPRGGRRVGGPALRGGAAPRRAGPGAASLVAPADVEAFACPSELRPFAP